VSTDQPAAIQEMKALEAVLQCPISGGGLVHLTAADARLKEINRQIEAGTLRCREGSMPPFPLAEAFVNESAQHVYPVLEGIVVLHVPQALSRATTVGGGTPRPGKKDAVARFYDQLGWKLGAGDYFEDAILHEDLRPITADYRRECNLRVAKRLGSGTYLLDVASGPVQYDDYLAFGERFEHRLCADLSIAALRHARRRVGEQGYFLLCDITNLPLREGAVDGVVSLHTVYHVPAGEQAQAFSELYRVLRPGGSAVVVYSWGSKLFTMRAAMIPISLRGRIRALGEAMFTWRGRRRSASIQEAPPPAKPALYWHTHDYRWVRREVLRRMNGELACWRSVSVPFLQLYARGWFGSRLLSWLVKLEDIFPRVFGRWGQYPMFILHKSSSATHDA
jgi:SAM-dependent methyltransferase